VDLPQAPRLPGPLWSVRRLPLFLPCIGRIVEDGKPALKSSDCRKTDRAPKLENRVFAIMQDAIAMLSRLTNTRRLAYSPVMSAMTTFDPGSTNKICFSTIVTS
jgi:hypothetical protein